MNKTRTLLLVSLLTPLSLCGCQKENNHLVVAEVTRSIFYAPMYVALNNGYFTQEGLKITLITTPGADKTMAALLSKEAQIGLMGPEASIYVYNNGQENYAINFAQLTQKDGSFLVSREHYDPQTFSFDSLKNKTVIGGRKGGMPEMVLEYVLKQKGYEVGRDDPSKQICVRTDIQFDVMAGAFTSGNGDFVTLFEPSATQMELINEGYIVASMGEHCGEIPYTCFSTLKSFYKDHDSQLMAFSKAIQKGVDYVYSHTALEVAKIIQPSFPSSELSLIETVVKRYSDITAWSNDLYLSQQSFEKLQDIMELAGELSQRAPYEKLVNMQYVK